MSMLPTIPAFVHDISEKSCLHWIRLQEPSDGLSGNYQRPGEAPISAAPYPGQHNRSTGLTGAALTI